MYSFVYDITKCMQNEQMIFKTCYLCFYTKAIARCFFKKNTAFIINYGPCDGSRPAIEVGLS